MKVSPFRLKCSTSIAFLVSSLLFGCASAEQRELAATGSSLVSRVSSEVATYSERRDLLDERRHRIAESVLASARADSEVGMRTLRLLDASQGGRQDRSLSRVFDEIMETGDRYLAETATARESAGQGQSPMPGPALQGMAQAARALANLAEPLGPGEALMLIQGLAGSILSSVGSSEGSDASGTE